LTGSRKGIAMSSSGSTSLSRYERPLGPALGPTIEERGCEADSFKHVRPFDVMLWRRDEVASAGAVAGADEPVELDAVGLEAVGAGTGPACCATSALS
jgi:hypothetical protein